MESRSADDEREERHPLWHCPCRYVDQLVNACLKCLGLDQYGHSFYSTAADRQQYYPPSPPPQTEMEMKFTEEVVVMGLMATRPLRVKRPPLNSGSGSQIN